MVPSAIILLMGKRLVSFRTLGFWVSVCMCIISVVLFITYRQLGFIVESFNFIPIFTTSMLLAMSIFASIEAVEKKAEGAEVDKKMEL